jgi:SAM-dependent methyltransferase
MDHETIEVYNSKAADYVNMVAKDNGLTGSEKFLNGLPKGARVLDYGCGPAHAAAYFASKGFDAHAFDASKEMVSLAQAQDGVTAWQSTFDAFNENAAYHGIWASFSLLHAPRDKFPKLLNAIHKALLPEGNFFLGMKLGEGEARDDLGRLYTYYTEPDLKTHLHSAGFHWQSAQKGRGAGLDGSISEWILIHAHA